MLLPTLSAQSVGALGACTSTWTVSPVAVPSSGVFQTVLNGISTTGSGGWTVGGLTDRANMFHAYAAFFDGSGWSQGAPVDAPQDGTDTWLNDVVTFATGTQGQPEAWAVGYAGPSSTLLRPQAIIEHWTGPSPTSTWTVLQPKVSDDFSDLVSVSATGPDDVFAVGNRRTGAIYRGLVMRYDGQRWTTMDAAPLPDGTLQSGLVAVAAVAPDNVWAVGWRSSGTGYTTLTEHWNGSKWSVVKSPNPGPVENVLLGVAASGDHAIAVGYRDDGAGLQPLVERFDGHAWSVVTAPPVPTGAVLRSVTVSPTTGRVWAAGFAFDPVIGPRPYAATADASTAALTWTVTPTAPVGDHPGREIREISADPTGNQIWAVGAAGQPLLQTICPSGASVAADRSETSSPAAPTAAAPIAAGIAEERLGVIRAPAGAQDAQLTVATDVAATALPGEPAAVTTNGATVGDVAGPAGPGPDGFADLLIGRFGDGPLELWINQQDGTWQRDDEAGFPVADRYGCVVADLVGVEGPEPDGLPDIFCTIGAAKGTGLKANELWVQERDGSFSRQIARPEVLQPFGRGRVAAAFYPGDRRAPGAHPDALFIGNQFGRGDGVPNPNRFFVSIGGHLIDTPAARLDLEIGASCAQPVDFDRDRFNDLLVCTNLGRIALFHNDGIIGGTPTFDEVSREAGIAQTGVKFAMMRDLNGDRCPDLVEVFAGRLDVLGQRTDARGDCDGVFARTWHRPLESGRSVAAGDVNGDRRPDLYVLQGGDEPDVMLVNDRRGFSFSSVPIPQATSGAGDDVQAIPNPDTGLTDFLVLNGDHTPGPVQLIRFSPSSNGVRITSGPRGKTPSSTAKFGFRASVGSSFLCSMDGGDPRACRSGVTYRGLDKGRHRFAVWVVGDDEGPLAEDTRSFKCVVRH